MQDTTQILVIGQNGCLITKLKAVDRVASTADLFYDSVRRQQSNVRVSAGSVCGRDFLFVQSHTITVLIGLSCDHWVRKLAHSGV